MIATFNLGMTLFVFDFWDFQGSETPMKHAQNLHVHISEQLHVFQQMIQTYYGRA